MIRPLNDKMLMRANRYASSVPKFILSPLLYLVEKPLQYTIRRLRAPLYLYFYVSNRCNARCKHCFYAKEIESNAPYLGIEEIRKIFCTYYGNIRVLHLTGGEPFLREEIDEIAEIASQYVNIQKIVIPTNGFLTKTILTKVSSILSRTESDLSVIISLDAYGEAHNRIRGVNEIFERAVMTIQRLKELSKDEPRLSVSALTTVSQRNLSELKRLQSFISKLDVPCGIQPVRSSKMVYGNAHIPLSGYDPPDTELLTSQELESIYDILVSRKTDDFHEKMTGLTNKYFIETIKNRGNRIKCFAGYVDGIIYANGDVAFCEMLKPIGNLRDTEYNFDKLWNSERSHKTKAKLKCHCVHPCNLSTSICLNATSLVELFHKSS